VSLRLRLLLIIGVSFTLFWTVASVWMLVDLRTKFRDALDERLAASARMVAGLVAQLPPAPPAPMSPMSPARTVPEIRAADGVACEVRLQRGGLLARTRNSPDLLGLGATGYRTRQIDGVQWRSYTLEQNGVRVTTADRVERREQLLRGIVAATAVPVLIAMFASLLALWFGVRRGLAPLEGMRKALAARDPDALHPLPASGLPAELAPLAATVNALLGRIGRAIERERSFTGDAAHELRTPLTAVKTHIQVARLAGGGADTERALAQAEEGVLRLQSTIDQLLMLARLEAPFPFEDQEPASARSVAERALQQLAPACRDRVELIAGEGAGAAALALPCVLAVTAIRNIVDNALRHAPADTTVTLRIAAGGKAVSFSAEDRGPGMSEAERAHAAQRFWRKGRGQEATGLARSAAIVERYGGALELLPRVGGGLVARVTLPAA
jgi:signal transduction histidine kinase